MKKLSSIFGVILLAFAITLTSCGNSEEVATEEAATEEAATEEAATEEEATEEEATEEAAE